MRCWATARRRGPDARRRSGAGPAECRRAAAAAPVRYLTLPEPQRLAWPAQDWEGDQQPHTLSVIELNRAGFRYWGWYGLNHGRGIGLARSHDLIHWIKYEGNPLWLNARWPSVLRGLIRPSRAAVFRHHARL